MILSLLLGFQRCDNGEFDEDRAGSRGCFVAKKKKQWEGTGWQTKCETTGAKRLIFSSMSSVRVLSFIFKYLD